MAAPVPEHKGLDFNALIFCWLIANLFLFPCVILILPVICVHITIKWPAQQRPQQATEHGYKKANGPLATLLMYALCVCAMFSLWWLPFF